MGEVFCASSGHYEKGEKKEMTKKEWEQIATIIGNWMISIDKLDRDSAEYQQESKLLIQYKEKVKKVLEMKWELCLISDYSKDVLRVFQDIMASACDIWMTWKNENAA